MGPNRVMAVTFDGFVGRTRKQRGGVSEQKSYTTVVLANRTGTDPNHITGGAERVEISLAVVGHAHGQNVAFEY